MVGGGPLRSVRLVSGGCITEIQLLVPGMGYTRTLLCIRRPNLRLQWLTPDQVIAMCS